MLSITIEYSSIMGHLYLGRHNSYWTGSKDRLDRGLDKRDKPSYAREEMTAEIGAAFLCAELNFNYSGVEDHAGYIASWLKVLKSDDTAIFTAASLASKAVEFILESEKIKAVA